MRKIKYTFFLFLFSLHWGCSQFSAAERHHRRAGDGEKALDQSSNNCLQIHNGDIPTANDEQLLRNVGFVLQINSAGSLVSICSGYLIRPDVVLTAQHCVADSNQNPTVHDVFFSFDNLDDLIAQSHNRQPLNGKWVDEIIQWAEKGENYRDVALIRLESSYDERYVPFDLAQQPISDPNAELIMAGFGNYVQGSDLSTFDQGTLRTGRARFNGYRILNSFPEFNNSNYIEAAEYLSTLPNSANQMICQGDSGSALFQHMGHDLRIVGITSLQDTFGSTPEAMCANSREGLFVPVNSIRSWVHDKLMAIDPAYALESYTTLRAEVLGVNVGSESSLVMLRVTRFHDNGLNLDGENLSAVLCTSEKCPMRPRLFAKIKKEASLNIKIKENGGKYYIAEVYSETISPYFDVEFKAMLIKRESPRQFSGRTETDYYFQYVDPLPDSPPVPWVREEISLGTYCNVGCSKNSEIVTPGFSMSHGKGVRIQGAVIHGQLYLRKISAEPSYDRERVFETRGIADPAMTSSTGSRAQVSQCRTDS